MVCQHSKILTYKTLQPNDPIQWKHKLMECHTTDAAHELLPLLNAQVRVDAGIASCACEIFVFSVWYVLSCPVVSVFLGQTKVNEEQLYKQSEKRNTNKGNSF